MALVMDCVCVCHRELLQRVVARHCWRHETTPHSPDTAKQTCPWLYQHDTCVSVLLLPMPSCQLISIPSLLSGPRSRRPRLLLTWRSIRPRLRQQRRLSRTMHRWVGVGVWGVGLGD